MNIKSALLSLAVSSAAWAVFAGPAAAIDPVPRWSKPGRVDRVDPGRTPKEKPTLPSSGLIAGTKTGEYGATVIDGPWGGIKTGDNPNPISGSCSKSGSFNWTLRVFNNTEDRYDASLQMVQYDIRNRELKSDNFFSSLSAGQKLERIYPAHPESAQCAVKLNHWKMIPRKKSQEEVEKLLEKRQKQVSDLQSQLPPSPVPTPAPARRGRMRPN